MTMSGSQNRTGLLAARISELTAAWEGYHRENGIPPLTFDERYWNEHQYPEEIERIRTELIDATQELQDLVVGPRKMLRLKLLPTQSFLDVVYTFNLPQKVPVDGKISYKELSDAVGLNESIIKRIVRYATLHRVFQETEPGFVSHSAASRLLLEEPAMFDWLGTNLHFVTPAMLKQAAAIQKWPHAEGPSQTAFSLSDSTGSESFWKFLAADTKRAKMFASSMTVMSRHGASSLHHVVENYPWASFGRGTVVDVGGSAGDLGFAIAESFPGLNIIVQDLPKVLATAKERPGLNVTFMNHDYYEPQPVHGADVYMFRWCFHDMRDGDAINALRALVPALIKGSRVLLVDAVMPEAGSLPNIEERWLRSVDLGMAALFNARERELEEWRRLFSLADSRFVWHEVKQPEGSRLALIESVWEPGRAE